LIVTDAGHSWLGTFLGNGNGTFQKQNLFKVGSGPFSLTIGDFNHDTKLDVATANTESNNVSVLIGNGDGTFHYQTTYETGRGPWFVTVGDFNNDDKIDLVVTNINI